MAKESALLMKSLKINRLGLDRRGASAPARQFLPSAATRLAGRG
jgi:hypothetical protein